MAEMTNNTGKKCTMITTYNIYASGKNTKCCNFSMVFMIGKKIVNKVILPGNYEKEAKIL